MLEQLLNNKCIRDGNGTKWIDEEPWTLIQSCQPKPRSCSEKQNCLLQCIKLCKYLNPLKIDLATQMRHIQRFWSSASSNEVAERVCSAFLKMKPLSRGSEYGFGTLMKVAKYSCQRSLQHQMDCRRLQKFQILGSCNYLLRGKSRMVS